MTIRSTPNRRISRLGRVVRLGAVLALGLVSAAAESGSWQFVDGQWSRGVSEDMPADGVALVKKGQAVLPIVISDEVSPPESTAASELKKYLEKMSGAEITVIPESSHTSGSPAIFVGRTRASGALTPKGGGDLGSEEWRKTVQGGSLYLYGGFPRGTLYAVYHLLEDELGVHWWTEESTTVPRRTTVTVSQGDREGQPAFASRTICFYYAAARKSRDVFEGNRMIAAKKYDGGAFAARNRLNNQGSDDYQIRFEFGGELAFGPPGFCHTYYNYVDPKQHFRDHPDWFSLVDGVRQSEAAQLDVLNPGLRSFFLAELRAIIARTAEEDGQRGYGARKYFDISPNDHEGFDEGPASKRLVEQEGTEMAPLLDFVNFLADGVKDAHPDVRLETLAYKATLEPPKTIAARDNVVITIADTESHPGRALTEDPKGEFLALLDRWKSKARNLRIWDYANAYGVAGGSLPLPFGETLYADLGTYHQRNIEGVLIEIGEPWLGDGRDFLNWVLIKGLEDPEQKYSALEKTFTDGYFGPAGAFLREYHALLRNAARSPKADKLTAFSAHLPAYQYLDLAFVREADRLFNSAEAAVTSVTSDPDALHRVRKARLGLDEAILRLFSRGLREEWLAQGGQAANFPIRLDTVRERYTATATRNLKSGVLPEHFPAWEKFLAERMLVLGTREVKPSGFPEKQGEKVFDYLPDQMSWNSGIPPIQQPIMAGNRKILARPVADAAADSGVAFEVTFSTSAETGKEIAAPPLLWRYFGLTETRNVSGAIPDPEISDQYQWIKLGSFPSTRRGLASLFSAEGTVVGAIGFNTDYYPDLHGSEAPSEFWVKIRRVSDASGAPAFRVSRAMIVRSES